MNSLPSSQGMFPPRQWIPLVLIPAALLSLFTLPACTENKEQTLTISGNIKIDSKSTEDYVNFFFTPLEDLILSPLVAYDPYTDSFPPVLVNDVVSMEEGRVWKIKLREGVKFHDGTPLTADDVAFSIEKRRHLYPSINAIRKAKVLDPATLQLTLDAPFEEISDILNTLYVYPRHLLEKAETWQTAYLENPVGSGPYKFKRWLENGLELVAHEEYFEGRPKIGRIVYLSQNNEGARLRSLLQGDADVMMPVSPKVARFLEKDRKFHVNKLPLPYYTALFLNVRSELFSDHRLRQAVNMAVNRAAIIEKGVDGAGVPTYSPFTKEMLPEGYAVPPIEYDPKTAVQLLETAGWKDRDNDGILDKGGNRLKIKLLYLTSSAEYKRVADALAGQLYEIGIAVETEGIGYDELENSLHSLVYDALLIAKRSLYPEAAWHSVGSHDGDAVNYSGYADDDADALFESLKGIAKPHEIKEIHAMIERIIRKDTPAAFLYTPVSYAAANKKFIAARGYQGLAYDNYRLKDWE